MEIKIYSVVTILFMSMFYSSLANSHARMKSNNVIVPRNNSDSLKSGPCGGVARTLTPKEYAPGSTVTIQWEETINHPGRFEFYFSQANDANFVFLKSVADTQDTTNDLPHQYTTDITFPNVSCNACTLQMIQVMTDRNPPTNYYSCSDIKLTGSVSTAPVVTPPKSTPPNSSQSVNDCQTSTASKK